MAAESYAVFVLCPTVKTAIKASAAALGSIAAAGDAAMARAVPDKSRTEKRENMKGVL
jgi:hypothetical protein